LFLLQIIKFEEIKKNCSYTIVYDLYNYIWVEFFLISSNLIICKKNNAKIILSIFSHYYYFFSCIKQCNFTKERKIYEHIWTYFVYNYIRLYIFIYLYICSYMKNFLPDTFTIIYLFVNSILCSSFRLIWYIFCFKFIHVKLFFFRKW